MPSLDALRQSGWPITVAAIADYAAPAIATAAAAVPNLLRDAESFTEGEALLQAAARLRLDAVLLLTQPEVTITLLRSCLVLGLTTFAEKPVADEAATLQALVEAAARPDAPPVQVGYNRRWQPLAPDFREHLSHFQRTSPSGVHVEANLWRATRGEAIFYRDTMIHAVDFLQWCLGPLEVCRVTVWPPLAPDGIASGLRAELRTTGDAAPATVHLDVRPSVGRNRESYLALGQKASAELTYTPANRDIEPALLSVWDSSDGPGSRIWEAPLSPVAGDPILWERGFLPQMAGFLSLVSEGDKATNRCSLADALAARQITDSILSYQTVPALPDKS